MGAELAGDPVDGEPPDPSLMITAPDRRPVPQTSPRPWMCRHTGAPTVSTRVSCRPVFAKFDCCHVPCLTPWRTPLWAWKQQCRIRRGLSSPHHVATTLLFLIPRRLDGTVAACYFLPSPAVPSGRQKCSHTRRFGTLAGSPAPVVDMPRRRHPPGHQAISRRVKIVRLPSQWRLCYWSPLEYLLATTCHCQVKDREIIITCASDGRGRFLLMKTFGNLLVSEITSCKFLVNPWSTKARNLTFWPAFIYAIYLTIMKKMIPRGNCMGRAHLWSRPWAIHLTKIEFPIPRSLRPRDKGRCLRQFTKSGNVLQWSNDQLPYLRRLRPVPLVTSGLILQNRAGSFL